MRISPIAIIACGLLFPMVDAAENRVWTSRKGSNLEAQLLSVDGNEVVLMTGEGREIKLKVSDLSLADRQYMVEYGNADPKVLVDGEVGEPEEDVRIDSKTFKRLDEPLQLGASGSLEFDLLETEHFLIGTAGKVRPQGIAETAERLWHGMAFEHMNFRRDWGDTRRLILLVEDREAHKALGEYYQKLLKDMNQVDAAARSAALWDRVGSTRIMIDDEVIEKYKLQPGAKVFNVTDDDRFRKAMTPFPTHSIAGDLLSKQMGGVSNFGANGYFAIITGHAYFKEIKLAGETQTQLIDASGSQFDEITNARGFEDGTSWAKTLRKLVKRDKVKPDFAKLLSWKQTDLDAEKLVLIYSFAYWCQSTPELISGFANVVRRIETSDQVPEPIEFARLMGFESVKDLEEAWIEFVESTQFK